MRCPEPTKVRYFTVHEANAALLSIWKSSPGAGTPMQVYMCPAWDGDQAHFHLTSETPAESAEKAKRKPPTPHLITDGAVPKPRTPKQNQIRGRSK